MKKVIPESSWDSSWQYSYSYDLMEIYGDTGCKGYAYAYANRCQHTLKLIQKVAKPKARILDIAAGQGNFTLKLAELGYDVTWNDLREELIDYVKMKWEYGAVSYAPGNILDLNFPSKFDVVLIGEVIEHVAHPDKFLEAIARLVKPSGHIVMSTPNGEYFRNKLPKFSECADPSKFESVQFKPNSDGHIFLLHIDELNSLAKNSNLLILETNLFNNTLTNGHLKSRVLLNFLYQQWVNAFEKFTNSLPLTIQRKIHTGMIVLFSIQA